MSIDTAYNIIIVGVVGNIVVDPCDPTADAAVVFRATFPRKFNIDWRDESTKLIYYNDRFYSLCRFGGKEVIGNEYDIDSEYCDGLKSTIIAEVDKQASDSS